MAVNRRSFLAMLGATIAAPAMPMAAPRLGPQIKALAAAHARKYPYVSVTGISKRIGVAIPEAEKLLIDLSRKGLVGPVNSSALGPISASSKVFRPVHAPVFRTRKAKSARSRSADRQAGQSGSLEGATDWLKHLHRICRDNGFVLSPRACEAVI